MGSSKKAHDRLAIEKRKLHGTRLMKMLCQQMYWKPLRNPDPDLSRSKRLPEHSMDNTGSSDKQVEREAVEDVAIEALISESYYVYESIL